MIDPKAKGHDLDVKDVILMGDRDNSGGCVLGLELVGRPGDASEKLFEAVNGKGYAVFRLDERATRRLFRMVTGVVAYDDLTHTRLVVPA